MMTVQEQTQTKLHEIQQMGQSIWYDNIRRALLDHGELEELLAVGVSGVTSNPTIFEKAIAGSMDYDESLRKLDLGSMSVEAIYESLALEDIGRAADLLRPVYDQTKARDGYVSFEVSPRLARDTQDTITEAKRLFKLLDRPNVMIKVPATPQGIPAITELIASGINVNATLIFGQNQYRAVAEAYLKGLERLAALGRDLSGVASVASFFISRIDTALDPQLKQAGAGALAGQIAIASAKTAYAQFTRIFSGSRWSRLTRLGAQAQRLLWASTGTKNPEYPDTLYVDELVGPETVNTIPPATLAAVLHHGHPTHTLAMGLPLAQSQLKELAALGIDLEEIAAALQDEGVAAFEKSFEALIASVTAKRDRLLAGRKSFSVQLGQYQPVIDHALKELRVKNVIARLWQHDHTLWKESPTEISNRLGWLHSPENMQGALADITDFVAEVRNAGFTQALLLGMGGSSLAPEVFRKTFGVRTGFLDLAVLDSTDAGAVAAVAEKLDLKKTLFIVSTKSGGTIETFSFFKYFYNLVAGAIGDERAGGHFIAITDPGSKLAEVATQYHFRKLFINDPHIGGRYSALSHFGLVPAALIGVDLERLLESAATMACNSDSANCPFGGDNESARLGAIAGELAKRGRDKLTLITSQAIESFGAWLEQLIAESTGKEGKGILPVAGEALAAPSAYADDRLFVALRLGDDRSLEARLDALEAAGHPVVRIHLKNTYELGAQFFLWEMATAIAGERLGINPFDQPNVESAKTLARQMVAAYQKNGALPPQTPVLRSAGIELYAEAPAADLGGALKGFFANAETRQKNGKNRSYVALQAYVQPSPETDRAIQELRTLIQTRFRLATTAGYGPRFLHSTGQLHKGDGGHGLFMQLTSDPIVDIAVPDEAGAQRSSITFGALKLAQALGDQQALLNESRKVIRLHLGRGVLQGLAQITEALS